MYCIPGITKPEGMIVNYCLLSVLDSAATDTQQLRQQDDTVMKTKALE